MRKLKDAAVKSAYITVAGKGTRLGRIARSIPKPLFLLGKSPIVDFIVKELIQAGIESIYFIVSEYNYPIFKSYYKNNSGHVNFFYIVDKELKGPGYAMKYIADTCKGDTALFLSGDRLIFKKNIPFYIKSDSIKKMIDLYNPKVTSNVVLVELNSQQRNGKHIVFGKNIIACEWDTFNFSHNEVKSSPYTIPKNISTYVLCGRCLISVNFIEKIDFDRLAQGKIELQVMDVISHSSKISNSNSNSNSNLALCLNNHYECIDLGTWKEYLYRNQLITKEEILLQS